MAEDLSAVLDASIVAGLASPRSYERGVLYVGEGRVGALRASGGRVAATVQGSESYAVELTADGGRLKFECSCPIGLEGAFCKHCVAVALRWLRDDGPSLPTLDDARERLEALAREDLVEMLIDHAHEDEGLARKLLLLAARPVDRASADLASVFALVDQAFVVHGFVPYREVICGVSLYRRLVSAAKRAGLPVLRFHDLRHSFGTQAIRAFNIYEVQRMMGHRHITTTERYLHYAPDPDAAAKLSRLWQSDSPTENVVSIRTAAA